MGKKKPRNRDRGAAVEMDLDEFLKKHPQKTG